MKVLDGRLRMAATAGAAITLAGMALIGPAAHASVAGQHARAAGPQDSSTTVHAVMSDLPGGGTQYTYHYPDGSTENVPIPPAGFDPATASASQLAEYDFPPKPTDSAQLDQWEADM